jgi:hypothetical protein
MLERVNTYQAGTTVRLECVFKDINGDLVNPTTARITFYDYRYNLLQEVTLTESNRKDIGNYFYDYTTSNEEQRIIYEWYGLVYGLPSVKRSSFRTVFV